MGNRSSSVLDGMIISVAVGIVLTLPISSAAICAAIGLGGGAVLSGLADGTCDNGIWNGLSLAGGAATAGMLWLICWDMRC